jgi:cytochrome c
VKHLILLLVALVMVNCHTQKKLEFEPPIGATPEVIKIYEDQFKKGKALYKIHCAECHGIYTNGKDSMPNFTDSQIHVYSVNVLGKSDNHGIMKKMSVEQFNYVLNFLRLRNPSMSKN